MEPRATRGAGFPAVDARRGGGGALPARVGALPRRPPHEARRRSSASRTGRRCAGWWARDGRARTIPPEGVLLTGIFAKTLERARRRHDRGRGDGGQAPARADAGRGRRRRADRVRGLRLARQRQPPHGRGRRPHRRLPARRRRTSARRVFADLKAMPQVAGANLREAAYAQFREMIDRSVGHHDHGEPASSRGSSPSASSTTARASRSRSAATSSPPCGCSASRSARRPRCCWASRASSPAWGCRLGLALGIALTLYFIWMLSTRHVAHALRDDRRATSSGPWRRWPSRRRPRVRRWRWRLRRLDLVGALKARE